ncbi:MAG TPA: hypothetical protein VMU51_31145 [Mycobacteriales bacterium]|nr:hypothetical protein [Mycobacteriales bacterium]
MIAEARAGSWSAKLRLAAAALADDDRHAAGYLATNAVDAAGRHAAALTAATGLLAAHGMWEELAALAGPRWVAGQHGPAAGRHLLAAYLRLRRIDPAEDVLHALYLLAADLPAVPAGELRTALRAEEFVLDGLRVTRHAPVAPTVQTRDFRDLTLPTPLWTDPAVELPLADGPRIAVVPLAFSSQRLDYQPVARGLMVWVAGALRRLTGADVSVHLLAHDRGPVADLHVRHTRDLMLDLTGLAGQPAYLVGGAVRHSTGLDAAHFRSLDIDVWRPDGQHVRFYQHLGNRTGPGARQLVGRLASACGMLLGPDTDPLPAARLLDELIPAYADAVPVVLACLGALPLDLLDRRRERIDRIVELAAAHPTEPEPRLLALGLLARLARSGWPILAEYRHHLADLAASTPPSADREALADVIRARLQP